MKRTRNRYHFEYRKCLKLEEKIRKNKLLDSCLNKGADLFTEIKAMRKTDPIIASTMDGSQDVKKVFKEKYEKLYNSAKDEEKLVEVLKKTEVMVTESSKTEIEKVTPQLIREATQKLKPGKSGKYFLILPTVSRMEEM